MFYANCMCLITSSLFWTALTALFTGCLFVAAWYQLLRINKTTSANLLIDFKTTFFTPENRKLFALIDRKQLTFFDSENFEIFNGKNSKVDAFEVDE